VCYSVVWNSLTTDLRVLSLTAATFAIKDLLVFSPGLAHQLARGWYLKAKWPGVEPATAESKSSALTITPCHYATRRTETNTNTLSTTTITTDKIFVDRIVLFRPHTISSALSGLSLVKTYHVWQLWQCARNDNRSADIGWAINIVMFINSTWRKLMPEQQQEEPGVSYDPRWMCDICDPGHV